MSSSRLWAVVPAAGSGRRFGGDTPKQYLNLLNKPIMLHSIDRLFALPLAGCVVAISEDDQIAKTLNYAHAHALQFVVGGAERMDSVLAGLDSLHGKAAPDDWVLAHDVARPCITSDSLYKLHETLSDDAVGGILAIPVRDTLKKAQGNQVVETVSRENLWQAQTPQMFRYGLLRDALIAARNKNLQVTDEASAMELAGFSVKLVEGRMDNIKVTYRDDLALAEAILQAQ
ncbi:MAG: 2-C-methyl-D-erythritol 4-phosphate cytidylyltransferase [Gammaproteobacteria bacterium]|nr:2-C-methyl-D-erythritol 4-phosphate cytidylyltransferase [Gammaproteobacteria bacterium]